MTTTNEDRLGGRLPLLSPEAMTDAQRALYEDFKGSWVKFADSIGVKSTTADGRLIGPFNVFLLHPEVTSKLSDFQKAEEQHTTLPARMRELAIITTGAVWGARYELYARAHAARAAGLSQDMVDTLVAGGIPEALDEDEKTIARLARALATTHRVDDALYGQARAAVGTQGLYDLVAVMGVYMTVCAGLALFEVPAP